MRKRVFLDANFKETTSNKAEYAIEAEYDETCKRIRETYYKVKEETAKEVEKLRSEKNRENYVYNYSPNQ
jgi:hypothetical protein